MLKTVATLFDPLGLLAPFVLIVKILLQDAWGRKIGWDEELPADLLKVWQDSIEDLQYISQFRMLRCYSPDLWHSTQLELHVFADASERGFGVVSYLRIVAPSGTISCSFVMAKCRNAPLKKLTIPRLELQAAVLAARMFLKLKSELPYAITRTQMWTDSMTALQYLKNTTRRFNTWTSNRVTEVLDATQPDWWRHVPTYLNPADDVSRGVSAKELVQEGHRFIIGPHFLSQPADQWPAAVRVDPVHPDDLEVTHTSQDIFVATTEISKDHILNLERFSRLHHLLRRTAWLFAWVRRYRQKSVSTNGSSSVSQFRRGPLTPDELHEALMYWIRQTQAHHFAEELRKLRSNRPISKSSNIFRLQPELVNDVIRVGGRIERAPVSYDAMHQIVLPQHSHITSFVVRDCHEKSDTPAPNRR